MRNEIFTAFDALSPAETEALLKHFDSLPIDHKAASRIRRSVESASVLRSPRRRTAKRALLAVASFLAVLVLLGVCFPKAAQAVASFFGINYTPTRYLTTLPETRTSIPAVEEALDAAAPAEGSYTITLLSDWDNAAEYEAYRAEQGLAPFAESDWEWLRDIRPEIAEVLYDGTALMWNVNLYTTSSGVEAFMRGFIDGSSDGQNVDALVSDTTYTVAGTVIQPCSAKCSHAASTCAGRISFSLRAFHCCTAANAAWGDCAAPSCSATQCTVDNNSIPYGD